MFRPLATSKVLANNNAANNNNSKQLTSSNKNENLPTTNTNSSTTTIREIRSRTVGSTIVNNNNGRSLLAHKRQAMSMERLNTGGGGSSITSSTVGHSNNDKEKSSPSSGSSNSINGSPQRAGGLNRTASRVSRFRSAKAVFERLSNNNNNINVKLDKTPEKPRGTVASRYAAAAAARATSHANNTTISSSPRSRAAATSLAHSHDNVKSASNIEINRVTSNNYHQQSPKSELHQPKPQPRVISNRISTTYSSSTSSSSSSAQQTSMISTTSNEKTRSSNLIPSTNKTNAQQSKLPAQDLIDKIVLEIASDAVKQKPDPDCTIQDLSSCDISGIPETLDFDRCFQDVEMMTEEEARKLLSKKHDSPIKSTQINDVLPPTSTTIITATSSFSSTTDTVNELNKEIKKENNDDELKGDINHQPDKEPLNIVPEQDLSSTICSNISTTSSTTSTTTSITKSKVRFSEEPAQICVTHAVEDYDRRNKDIDPVAASAEYELEKSKEREGILDNQDDDDDNNNDIHLYSTNNSNGAVNQFIKQQNQDSNSLEDNNPHGILIVRSPPNVPQSVDSCDLLENNNKSQNNNNNNKESLKQDDVDSNKRRKEKEEEENNSKEYIQSLEKELGLKRILEQNLRDLQSQYYEAVKELDEYKSSSEIKLVELEQTISDLNGKLECAQNELSDSNERSSQFEKQLNDIKESSQILEKKYHRAKRIIKDMQSREQSFNRREQLYQQKLDEIEYELGTLIESVFNTIHEDCVKFNNLINENNNNTTTRVQLDDFGLMKQILKNFNNNQSTQNPQIKQRVLSILEQHLTNLMVQSNDNNVTMQKFNNSTTSGIVTSTSLSTSISAAAKNLSISDNNNAHHHHHQQQQQQHHNLIDGNSQQINHHQLASHRLSQPNLPHPIGVGGQPTKLFHGISTMPITMPPPANEPSPPQSVNSYPSTNSLNSLNNNNNNNNITTNNNNIIFPAKLRDQLQQPINNDLSTSQSTVSNSATNTATTGGSCGGGGAIIHTPSMLHSSSTMIDEKFQPVPDIQVPYQTNEWHDKPVCEWTTTQVSTWLLALGLDQYISKFEDRNVNGQSLINLDSTVLKGLGVLNSNDRNLLKKKIRELRVEMEKERKLIEKKIKENLKDKMKNKQSNGSNRNDNKTDQTKPSWKRGLLS